MYDVEAAEKVVGPVKFSVRKLDENESDYL
jgi:hypothetical protein